MGYYGLYNKDEGDPYPLADWRGKEGSPDGGQGKNVNEKWFMCGKRIEGQFFRCSEQVLAHTFTWPLKRIQSETIALLYLCGRQGHWAALEFPATQI